MDIENDMQLLEELPSVSDTIVSILETYVSTFGWQRTLSDLCLIADRQEEGRLKGALVALKTWVFGEEA